jgi:hypothetical protein
VAPRWPRRTGWRWRLRATHELGTIDMLGEGRVDTLEQARTLAADAGALTVAAIIDLQLAGGYHHLGRADDVAAAGSRAARTGRQLRVSGTERAGTCLTVLRHALRGHRAALDLAVAAAQRLVDQDAGWSASLSGDARATPSDPPR